VRIGVSNIPHWSNGVFKLVLCHFGGVVKEVIEEAKAVGEVVLHFIGEVILVNCKKSIFIDGKFVILTFEFCLIFIKLILFALYNDMGSELKGAV
jgi:hypothetical protein